MLRLTVCAPRMYPQPDLVRVVVSASGRAEGVGHGRSGIQQSGG